MLGPVAPRTHRSRTPLRAPRSQVTSNSPSALAPRWHSRRPAAGSRTSQPQIAGSLAGHRLTFALDFIATDHPQVGALELDLEIPAVAVGGQYLVARGVGA